MVLFLGDQAKVLPLRSVTPVNNGLSEAKMLVLDLLGKLIASVNYCFLGVNGFSHLGHF